MGEIDLFGRRPPFHRREEFIASISAEASVISDLRVIVQYPEASVGEITALVTGDQKLAMDLRNFISAHPGPWSLKSRQLGDRTEGQSITSDRVWIRRIDTRTFSEHEGQVVAHLWFEDFVIRLFASREGPKRQLAFFLAGPRPWMTFWTHGQSYTGDVEQNVQGSSLAIDADLQYELNVRPWYFYDQDNNDAKVALTTHTMAVILESSVPPESLSDEEFLKTCSRLVDDLTLLASFVCRERVQWFGYSLSSIDVCVTFRRAGTEPTNTEYSASDLPFDRTKLYQFYATAYKGLRRLREEKIDITSAVHFFIDGCNRSRLVHEQFAMLFFALEHIKDILAVKLGLVHILEDSEFTFLRRELRSLLKRQSFEPTSIGHISEKLLELNRYSLKHCLSTILAKYGVEYLDLYPQKDKEMPFIHTRNELFHTAAEIEPFQLLKETERLRIIIQRLILRLLGWQDLHLCPSPIEKGWLVS